MKVKIFNSAVLTDKLENQIAEWTKDLNPHIYSVNITIHSLHDLFSAEGNPSNGKVCNQWMEYVAVIIYDLNNQKS